MRFGAVVCGVDIWATCQDQAVEAPNQRVESVFALFVAILWVRPQGLLGTV